MASYGTSASAAGVASEIDVEARPASCKVAVAAAIRSSIRNRYLCANVVYLVYAFMMIYIDYVAYPTYLDYYNNGDNDAADAQNAFINRIYTIFNVVHLINATQYYWSWLPWGYRWNSVVMIPEYLNMIGACLYIASAQSYGPCYVDSGEDIAAPSCMRIHRLETAASAIETVAALGWFTTWYLTYPRGVPGRGWTLDDPDAWGNIGIVVPSLVYLAYNVQVIRDPSQYGTNFLYVTGDLLYFLGSLAYMAAALRDDGWWWFMPLAGKLPGGLDSKAPVDAPVDTDAHAPIARIEEGSSAAWFAGQCLGCTVTSCPWWARAQGPDAASTGGNDSDPGAESRPFISAATGTGTGTGIGRESSSLGLGKGVQLGDMDR